MCAVPEGMTDHMRLENNEAMRFGSARLPASCNPDRWTDVVAREVRPPILCCHSTNTNHTALV
jgi:hypothetical protein